MEKEYNLKGIKNKCVLCKVSEGFVSKFVIMEAITEKQEKQIDDSSIKYGTSRYYIDKETFVSNKDIYVYGELNLNDKNDIKLLKKFNLVDPDLKSFIHTNVDYIRGIVTTQNGVTKIAPTIDPIRWIRYNHLLLGQPKRIIIYRIKHV